jgi:hypothetical protein
MGGGFLLAVLWMDLIFDVQALRAPAAPALVPEPALASVAAYYRRATTESRPMSRLIALAMLVTVGGSAFELARGDGGWLGAAAGLALCAAPAALAAARVVPNAVRLGARADDAATQSALARRIGRDHVFCFAAITAFLALRLAL